MSDLERIRSFNRTVTGQVGALHSNYLGRRRSLGACRMLFEIGTGGVEIRELRDRLGLDSGYTSRLLRGLERARLIRVSRSPDDRRARLIELTAAGRREVQVLNRLSDQVAGRMIASLTDRQRTTLVDAMTLVERLLLAASVEVRREPAASRTAQACLAQYFRELNERFEQGFDPALSISASVEEMTPPRGQFVIAALQQRPVGCGGLIFYEGWAYIKRMWVAPTTRGMGLGRRILGCLEEQAGSRGVRVVRLETNKALSEARSLYLSSGYREVRPFNDEPYAHHWFEKTLSVATEATHRADPECRDNR